MNIEVINSQADTLDVDLLIDEWDYCGPEENPSGRLYALNNIHILGCPMHVEAYEVITDADGVQRFTLDDEHLGQLLEIFDTDGFPQTTEIDGKPYCVFAHPYS
jgi:hypothetical protein